MKLSRILVISLLLSACQVEELKHSVPVDMKEFTISEAREFFEEDFASKITKSENGQRKYGKLHPGDFTPLWDKAVYSEKGGKAAYDVSIMTDRRIAATRLTADGAQRVRVYQKLVVTQSTSSGKMTAHIMSLIPDNDQGHFPKSFSSRKSYRGNYSGIVVYTTVDNGALVRVQEYKDGKLHRGVNLTSGKDSYLDQCRKAVEILKGIKFVSKRLIMTKSGEDWDDSWDDDDYDGWDINDFEDLGDGIYTDGEGNYYIDIDGDGDLDLETLAPGGITEDKEEEEDPWPPTPPDEPGDEPGDDWDDSWMEGDDENPLDIEMIEFGRQGVEKIKSDLENGNVKTYQYIQGTLTGFGTGANANGIILSATNFVQELSSDRLLQAFGKSICGAGIICGIGQTIIAVTDGDGVTTGDWMNIISTTLGIVCIFIPASFPIAAGAIGVTSGVIGIASAFFSNNVSPGLYVIETVDGSAIYLFISNTMNA